MTILLGASLVINVLLIIVVTSQWADQDADLEPEDREPRSHAERML